VARLHLAPSTAVQRVRVTASGQRVAASITSATEEAVIALSTPVTLSQGQTLAVSLS